LVFNYGFQKSYSQFLDMAKEEGGMLPSSQGGLMMYTDADTGFDLDPKVVIALGVGTGLIAIMGHARPILAGIFL
jgi:hypothetical protein